MTPKKEPKILVTWICQTCQKTDELIFDFHVKVPAVFDAIAVSHKELSPECTGHGFDVNREYFYES